MEVEAPLGVSGCGPLRPLEGVVSLCASLKRLTPKCHHTKLSSRPWLLPGRLQRAGLQTSRPPAAPLPSGAWADVKSVCL